MYVYIEYMVESSLGNLQVKGREASGNIKVLVAGSVYKG